MTNRTLSQTVSLLLPAALFVAVTLTGMSVKPVFAEGSVDQKRIDEGKALTFGRKKGNCLACHSIADGTLAGNGGPPLIQMKARFPDKALLRAQIWDPTVRNPNSLMPPFGRHGILSDDEIDKVTDYIYTL